MDESSLKKVRHWPKLQEEHLVTVDDVFGGWPKLQEHLASGDLLDQIYGGR